MAHGADGRVIKYGLCKGSSDLIGWTPVKITPDMVGSSLAVFTAIEVKAPGEKLRPEQKNFINAVIHSGGIAACVFDESELTSVLRRY